MERIACLADAASTTRGRAAAHPFSSPSCILSLRPPAHPLSSPSRILSPRPPASPPLALPCILSPRPSTCLLPSHLPSLLLRLANVRFKYPSIDRLQVLLLTNWKLQARASAKRFVVDSYEIRRDHTNRRIRRISYEIRISVFPDVHKLGSGSYATVWLARNIKSNTYVALKISTAQSFVSSGERESRIWWKLAAHEGSDSSHILALHQTFTVDGPNGTHQVLVTDVVTPLRALNTIRSLSTPKWRKAIARGLVLGVAHMHGRGVKHGDLHLGNLGCSLPEFARVDEKDIMHDFEAKYELTLILPRDPAKQTPSVPPYVVMPCKMAKYYERFRPHEMDIPDLRILDFGSAREAHEAASDLQCAVGVCSPEVAFARVALQEAAPAWGFPHDVWAVGAGIYEIIAGCPLLTWVSMGDVLLQHMALLAGGVPASWRAYWESQPKLQAYDVSHEAVEREWEERRKMLRTRCADDADAERLVALLRRVFVLEPEKRPTIEALAKDPWFQDAII